MTEDQNCAEARRWFGQAEDDVDFTHLGLEEEFYAQACFLSQQAGEKALKAFRYLRGERRVLGHSLVALVDSLGEQFVDLRSQAAELCTMFPRVTRMGFPISPRSRRTRGDRRSGRRQRPSS